MFDNIGEKIKLLAQILCWIGIPGSIVMAIIMIDKATEVYIASAYKTIGFLLLFIGPLIALVSSYVLYGFGQLIENSKTQALYMEKLYDKMFPDFIMSTNNSQRKANTTTDNSNSKPAHEWMCANCGKMISESTCRYCGNKADYSRISPEQNSANQKAVNTGDVPYWCGKCGKSGPYEEKCPECGSTMKLYNN